MTLNYAKKSDAALSPVRATATSAGIDLCTPGLICIEPRSQCIVDTQLVFEIPVGYYGQLALRSSIAKDNVALCGGIIDSDYRGSIMIVLQNHDLTPKIYTAGSRIAQLIIIPCMALTPKLCSLSELSSTARGSGGFGSTGK